VLLKAKVVAPPVCLSQTSGGAIKASKLAHYSRGRACSAIFVGIFKEAIYGKQY